jgi:hypothetical protein
MCLGKPSAPPGIANGQAVQRKVAGSNLRRGQHAQPVTGLGLPGCLLGLYLAQCRVVMPAGEESVHARLQPVMHTNACALAKFDDDAISNG